MQSQTKDQQQKYVDKIKLLEQHLTIEKQKNSQLEDLLDRKNQEIEGYITLVQDLKEKILFLQNYQRKSSSQKFTSTMENIPEDLDESNNKNKIKNDTQQNDLQKVVDQMQSDFNNQNPKDENNSNQKKNFANIDDDDDQEYQRRKSILLDENSITLNSKQQSKENKLDQNSQNMEIIKLPSQNNEVNKNSEPQQQRDEKLDKVYNEEQKEQKQNEHLQQQKKISSIIEPLEVSFQPQNLENQKQNLEQKPKTELVLHLDLDGEEQSNQVRNQSFDRIDAKKSSSKKASSKRSSYKKPSIVKTDSSNLPNLNQIRVKAASYYNQERSSQYIESMKKSIVALSYDINEEQNDSQTNEYKTEHLDTIEENMQKSNKISEFQQEKQNQEKENNQQVENQEQAKFEMKPQFQLKKSRTTNIDNNLVSSPKNRHSVNPLPQIQVNFQKKSNKNNRSQQTIMNQTERNSIKEDPYNRQYNTFRKDLDQSPYGSKAANTNFLTSPLKNKITSFSSNIKIEEDQIQNSQGQSQSNNNISSNNNYNNNSANSQNNIQNSNQNQVQNQNQKLKNQRNSIENRNSTGNRISSGNMQDVSLITNKISLKDETLQDYLNERQQEIMEGSFKLFEKFYIIGVDKETLIKDFQENPEDLNLQEGIQPAKILYTYPTQEEADQIPADNIIHDFTFPFGVNTYKVTARSKTHEAIKDDIIIQGGNKKQMVNKFFYFTIRDDRVDIAQPFNYLNQFQDIDAQENLGLQNFLMNQKVLQQINPQLNYFGICVKIKDFFEISADKMQVPEKFQQDKEQEQENKSYKNIKRMNEIIKTDISQPGGMEILDSEQSNKYFEFEHAFETFLHPFQWPHPILFTLPESLLQLLDSPVSLLLGLNQPESYIDSESIDQQYPNHIFVYLDSQRIYCTNTEVLDNIEENIPNFNNLMNYNIINVKGAQFWEEHEKHKKKQKNQGFLNRIFNDKNNHQSSPKYRRRSIQQANNLTSSKALSNSQNPSSSVLSKSDIKNNRYKNHSSQSSNNLGGVINQLKAPIKYYPKQEETAAGELIQNIIYQTLITHVVEKIPGQFKFDDDGLINIEDVCEQICFLSNEQDKRFIRQFCNTTIFTHYLEKSREKQQIYQIQ
ncbi:hypothetical protein PPERSA_06632 [Pseudocohnilembus persalinus]|uniref:cDENN domain-containing protein n=1 Tax=Pseudocohnilembus persalinus TaxID=266149 RepID=A0A0V0QRW0_PSEPJ|nr:hypothetical protein PPERSA_06632 [Pseudocohnilembus persalinus]|eukprot:KRX04998.1 hypothetical protein PPERSA_06632 [Pseudocohnilembus persalinus]